MRKHKHLMQIRFDDEFKSLLEHHKATTGASYASIIRRAVLGLPPPKPLVPPLAKFDELAVTSLNQIGNNLNQIAKRMNQSRTLPITKHEISIIDMALVALMRYALGLTDKLEIIDTFKLTDAFPPPKPSPASAPSAPEPKP